MTNSLGGLEILTKRALQFAKNFIQSKEKVIGCVRATGEGGEDSAFIALDTRLLYINPPLKQSHSIEYLDIQTIEIKRESFLLLNFMKLEVRTTYSGEASWLDIMIDQRHEQYALRFAEVVRIKSREARTPSTRLEKHDKNPAGFIDELERLANLRKQGTLTQEEFEAAKRKLLS